MNKIKEQFKKDFEESSNKVNLTFDASQLEPNIGSEEVMKQLKKTKRNRRRIIVSCVSAAVVLTVVGVSLSQLLEVHSNVRTARRTLSVNAISIAESNTFRKLNNVKYPEGNSPESNEISKETMSAYNNFANETYHSLVDTSKKDNMSYAAVGLYSIMNELYGAISRDELKTQFDQILGLDETSRKDFYSKVMKANSYISEFNTTQIKNSAFFNTQFEPNQEYVNKLTDLYCEAYSIDFKTEASKMVEWVNEAVGSDDFIDTNFLNMSIYTQLYYFSTLYFKNAWATKYLAADNFEDDFYLSNGSKKTTTYMVHSYMTADYYDYGSYISLKDYYLNGNASITYILPKKTSDDVFALTRNANIFKEKEENKVRNPHSYGDYYEPFYVHLQTPKFKVSADLDLIPTLTNLGFADMFSDEVDSFNKAFDDPQTSAYKFYLEQVKQKNDVEFNEDGAIVKSVSMGSIGSKGGDFGPMGDTLEVKLDQPFIYIIRDCNDVPILVGHIDNPKY